MNEIKTEDPRVNKTPTKRKRTSPMISPTSIRTRKQIREENTPTKPPLPLIPIMSSEALKPQEEFGKRLVPEKILGAKCDVNTNASTLMFLMKWKDNEKDVINLISAKEANEICPQLVIDFYEKEVEWSSPELPKYAGRARWPLPLGEKYFKGLEPEKVLGAVKLPQDTGYLVKWKDTEEPCILLGYTARKKCPHLVIAYYEPKLYTEGDFPPAEPKSSNSGNIKEIDKSELME